MLNFEDNFPLRQITTLGIGGPAKKFVIVKTEVELLEAIQFAKQNNLSTSLETGLNHLIIGGGSNLLVSDEGVDCLVIKNEISGIRRHLPGEQKRHLEGEILSVKSGTPLQELVDYTVHHGLDGLQKLTGVPGTVGGAVYGNAGAYGQTISDHISSVVILGTSETRTPESDSGCVPSGLTRMTLSNEDCHFNYRDSIFKKNHHPILEVEFRLEPGNPETLQQEAQDVLSKRLVKYPPGIKCPGSFFKNLVASQLSPEVLKNIPADKIVYGKIPAGSLLEEVGAKRQELNGIKIADHHANLFTNTGKGTAKALYDLAKTYAFKVKQKFGITLEPEVQLINLLPL